MLRELRRTALLDAAVALAIFALCLAYGACSTGCATAPVTPEPSYDVCADGRRVSLLTPEERRLFCIREVQR